MSILNIVVMVILFVALSPGIFLYIPSGSSKKVAALVHGLVFALIWYILMEFTSLDGFTEGHKKKKCSTVASIGCVLSGGKICENSC